MIQVIMLRTAQFAEKFHKETGSFSASKNISDFNRWEKKLVIIDEDDESKDVHYAINNLEI